MQTSELRKICQKGEGEIFLVSAHVYRPFTIYVTRLYLLLGIRSNIATLHSLMAGLIAAGFALGSQPIHLAMAAAFLQLYFVLDHVDGEVARFDLHRGKQQPSAAGEFFDFWTHFHTVNLVFALIGLGLFVQTGNLLWALLGIAACNISGNFQRMALARTVLCAVARRQMNLDDAKLAPVLDVCCDFSRKQRFAGKLPLKKTIELMVSEAFGFPGNILALTIVLLIDALVSVAHPGFYLFRAGYVIAYCAYGLLSKTVRTIVSIRQLHQVGLAS